MPDVGGLSGATPATSAATSGTGSTPRLHKAAIEFESVLLGQWLESAERSFGTVPGSEEDEDAGGQQMRSFAMQHLAGSLAATDTLGLARLVERGLEKAATAGTPTPSSPASAGQGAWRAKLPSNL